MCKYPKYEVLIFDLGNTILPIVPELTVRAFRNLGFEENVLRPNESIQKILSGYQKGEIETADFLAFLKSQLPQQIAEKQIIEAWNAMLLDFPKAHLELLEDLHKTHQLILLSNTNALHTASFEAKALKFGKPLSSYFDAVYYSQEIGMSKPDAAIYEYVHQKHSLHDKKVLFLDDLSENLVVPKHLGWEVVQILREKTILDL